MFALTAGCETLPSDGPSARAVREFSEIDANHAVIDLDYRASQVVAAHPPRILTSLSAASSQAPIDLIGPGDVLSVWIYQAGSGPTLGGPASQTTVGPRDAGPAAPVLAVDGDGFVIAPYAGRLRVGGLTAQQASAAIQRALVGKVMDPQVVVNVETNVANSVTVIGEVRNAGRFPLAANNDRLLDVLALAGGMTRAAADIEITLVRGDRSASTSMARVLADPAENVRLAPRDQIRLSHKPRKFSTFGALARASQVPIEDESLSLAGALSRMGGLDPTRADAESVLLFRFERPEVASALNIAAAPAPAGVPVIYRLNLKAPEGYFVANTFEVRPDDLIYVPRSSSTELRGFFELVSSITRVAYDISVAEVLR